jgi:hypothetical protein
MPNFIKLPHHGSLLNTADVVAVRKEDVGGDRARVGRIIVIEFGQREAYTLKYGVDDTYYNNERSAMRKRDADFLTIENALVPVEKENG